MNLNCLNCGSPLNLKGDINLTTSGFYGRCPNCGKIIIIENGKLIAEPAFNEALEKTDTEQLKQLEANNKFLYLNKHIDIIETIKRIFNNMYKDKTGSKKDFANFQAPTISNYDIEVLKTHLNWFNKEKALLNIQHFLEKDKANILQTLKIVNYIKQYKGKNPVKIIDKNKAKFQKSTIFYLLIVIIVIEAMPLADFLSSNENLVEKITFIPKTIFPFIETLSYASGYYYSLLTLFSLVFYFIIIFTPLRFFALIQEEKNQILKIIKH